MIPQNCLFFMEEAMLWPGKKFQKVDIFYDICPHPSPTHVPPCLSAKKKTFPCVFLTFGFSFRAVDNSQQRAPAFQNGALTLKYVMWRMEEKRPYFLIAREGEHYYITAVPRSSQNQTVWT